jgi:hypothetical protein
MDAEFLPRRDQLKIHVSSKLKKPSIMLDELTNKQSASRDEQEDTKEVHLFDHFPSCLAIVAVLDIEGRWVVEEEEENDGQRLESNHHIVGNAPVVGRFNDSPSCQRHELGNNAASIEDSDTDHAVFSWDDFL